MNLWPSAPLFTRFDKRLVLHRAHTCYWEPLEVYHLKQHCFVQPPHPLHTHTHTHTHTHVQAFFPLLDRDANKAMNAVSFTRWPLWPSSLFPEPHLKKSGLCEVSFSFFVLVETHWRMFGSSLIDTKIKKLNIMQLFKIRYKQFKAFTNI